MVTSSCWRKISVRGRANAIRSAEYGKITKTEKISRKADFRRRPTSPYYVLEVLLEGDRLMFPAYFGVVYSSQAGGSSASCLAPCTE
jgi:hypothetical protein